MQSDKAARIWGIVFQQIFSWVSTPDIKSKIYLSKCIFIINSDFHQWRYVFYSRNSNLDLAHERAIGEIPIVDLL